jgi:excisionase family DNA binding protein
MSEYVSTKELAKRLKISTRSVFRLLSAGRLPEPVRIGRRTQRWDWEEVEAFLKGQRKKGHSRVV